MASQKKGKEVQKFNDLQKFLGLPIFILILVISGFLIIQVSNLNLPSEEEEEVYKEFCGDGTSSGECSTNKPYYCNNGILVENSTICGCPENFTIDKESCNNSYKTTSRSVFFDYVLDGEIKTIPFKAYRDVEEYISNLSRSISYDGEEAPSRKDFKLKEIENPIQREFLLPLVVEIQNTAETKEDQVRIAISLVQQIPFGHSERTTSFGGKQINFSRYPYDVLWDREGVCGEKSSLLAFLLKELGYKVSLFYHLEENHESVGIGCPLEYSIQNTEYCFIETTGASIMTDNEIEFIGGITLESTPEIIPISDGESLGEDMYEYKDAQKLMKVNKILREENRLNLYRQDQLEKLQKKYQLDEEYNIS